jgi:hypothetical protein
MAVNELDRDHLRLIHTADQIISIINGLKMAQESEQERKQQVGNMVMHLEMEILDDKYEQAGKDLTEINSAISTGRTYWKS